MADPAPHWRRLIGGTALVVVAAFGLPWLVHAPAVQALGTEQPAVLGDVLRQFLAELLHHLTP